MSDKRHGSVLMRLRDQWGLRKADLMRSKEGSYMELSRAYRSEICSSQRCQGKPAGEGMFTMRSGEREKGRGEMGDPEGRKRLSPVWGQVLKEWARGEGARVSRSPRMQVVGRTYVDLDMRFPNSCFCLLL